MGSNVFNKGSEVIRKHFGGGDGIGLKGTADMFGVIYIGDFVDHYV